MPRNWWKWTTLETWISDAKNLLPGDEIIIRLTRTDKVPTYAEMHSALIAEFGADTLIRIYKHGDITIFIHANNEDRERFDARAAPYRYTSSDGTRKEYQNGFTREIA